MAQITMTNPAPANAHLDPNHPDAEAANCPNQSFEVLVCTSKGLFIFNLHILKARLLLQVGWYLTRSLRQDGDLLSTLGRRNSHGSYDASGLVDCGISCATELLHVAPMSG
jgi:hypothetical protein